MNSPYLLCDLLRKLEREFSYSKPAESRWEPDVCQFPGRADQSKPTFAGFKVSTLSLNTLTNAVQSNYATRLDSYSQ